MKILMLSIFAPHFFNWTKQLRDSGHKVYWLDIFDSNTKVEQIDFAEQIVGWRYRWDYPGRYFLKKNSPFFTRMINKFNERSLKKKLEKEIERIQPDIVHSFVMYLATAPVLETIKKFPDLKWVYTAWGSDMFYYQNKTEYLIDIKKTLPYISYMFADCKRDFNIAQKHGFKGKFLGVFPGGGGFDFSFYNKYLKKDKDRNILLIKGYQGLHGKCIEVLKALPDLKEELKEYKIVVFGASQEVFDYLENSPLKQFSNLNILPKIPYCEVMQLMGRSTIYIGNSTSDGMPNTLLEAIVMGAFPMQSNPGGATFEIIIHNKNGLLIQDPEDSVQIANLILRALKDKDLREKAVNYNLENIKPTLERNLVKEKVLKAYKKIESEL